MKRCPFHQLAVAAAAAAAAMQHRHDAGVAFYGGLDDPNGFCNLAMHCVNET